MRIVRYARRQIRPGRIAAGILAEASLVVGLLGAGAVLARLILEVAK
jgi:hypothetical protein